MRDFMDEYALQRGIPRICDSPDNPVKRESLTAVIANFLNYTTQGDASLGAAPLCTAERLSTLYTHLLCSHVPWLNERLGDVHAASTES